MKASNPHWPRRLVLTSEALVEFARPLIAMLALLASPVPTACAAEPSTTPLASTAAQAEAVRNHPALGVVGSAFHREFLVRVQRARAEAPGVFDDPSWPVALAEEVARALPPAASEAPRPGEASPVLSLPSATPDWYSGHSAETFGKLPAARQKLDRQALDHALLGAAIFHATNAARRSLKLRPLTHDPGLRAAAWEHSRDMAMLGFFSHENPRNFSRATPSLRLDAQGIKNMAAGENISRLVGAGYTYWGYARAVVTQWMKSPGHRANILNAKYTHLGCGAHPCRCPEFHLLATQNFAFVIGSTGRE